MSIGARLKNERLRIGLTQEAFAKLCATSKRQQIKYEKDQQAPGAHYLAAAIHVGVDVVYILTSKVTDAIESERSRSYESVNRPDRQGISPMNVNYVPTKANPAAKALKLDYTSAVDECYRIWFDHVHQLVVIGDLANASYEWVIEGHGKICAHSNDGYGDTSVALRDGLIAYHGLGDVTAPVELP